MSNVKEKPRDAFHFFIEGKEEETGAVLFEPLPKVGEYVQWDYALYKVIQIKECEDEWAQEYTDKTVICSNDALCF